LGLNKADQISVPGGSQIRALGVHRADDDHQSRERADRCSDRASKRPPISIPPALCVASSAQHRDNSAPRIGDRAIGQVWSFWSEQSGSTGEHDMAREPRL
jgi:hypothetical protein